MFVIGSRKKSENRGKNGDSVSVGLGRKFEPEFSDFWFPEPKTKTGPDL